MTNPASTAAGKLLSSLGSSKGGLARASRLTAEQRKAIARKAAAKRWGKEDAVFHLKDVKAMGCGYILEDLGAEMLATLERRAAKLKLSYGDYLRRILVRELTRKH